jgi:tetratricopeptide (TPR) repeat protein
MVRHIMRPAGAMMVLWLAAAPAQADFASDNKMCFTIDATKGAEKVAACTRLIQSGRLRGKDLAPAYQDRAEGNRLLKNLDASLADFDRAIDLNPRAPVPYVNRAEVHRLRGEYDEVIADASRAMGIDPTYTAAYTIRGLAYQEKGDLARARADYNKALAMPASRNDGQWAQDVARSRLKALESNN